jgi:hypothetical protein
MLRIAIIETIYNQTAYNLFDENLFNLIQIAQQINEFASEMNN